MTNKQNKIIFIIATFFILSCSENNENQSPSLFEINIDEVNDESATISWTESNDPEGSTVFYDVYLNSSKVADNITELSYFFEGLNENTNYTGKVIASDPEGNTVSVEFNFNTSSNQPPTLFSLYLNNNNPFNSQVQWTESTDPEGSIVTYNVYLNDELIEAELNSLIYNFDELEGLTEYSVTVEAVDGDGNTREENLTLTTTIKIYESSLTLDSQSVVDSFGQAGYNQINGNLNIGTTNQNNTDVVDLTSLSTLNFVDGTLSIRNTECQSLSGLDYIDIIDNFGKLIIQGNDNLTNLMGLGSIVKVHEFNITSNESLQSLDGLSNLTTVMTNLRIINNQNLSTLIGLSSLNNVYSGLNISNNGNLTNLNGLENIDSVNNYILINNNSSLSSLSGLDNLESCTTLGISNNSNLQNLLNLSNFTQVSTLYVSDNNLITNLNGLENLVDVNQSLTISRNINLLSLSGVENVTFSDNQANYHELIISQNNSIVNLDPLTNYSFDRGKINISQNSNLTDLCGISNLILGITEFVNTSNFTIANAYNPGIADFQNGECSLD